MRFIALSVPALEIPHLNPLDYLKDFMIESLTGLTTYFEKIFVHPPTVRMGAPLDYLYGNAVGAVGGLAITVALITTLFAILHRQSAYRAVEAIVSIVALVIVAPIWFALTDSLIVFGNGLSEAAMFYHPPTGHTSSSSFLGAPVFPNIPGAIFGGGAIAFWGSILVAIFFLYQPVIIFVKFGMLFAIALYALNHRLLYWLLSAGLVAMTLGRPGAILVIEISKFAADNGLYGDTVFGTVMYLTVGLIFAIGTQYAIYTGLRKKVFNSEVFGRVRSRVTGKVKSVVKRSPQQSGAMARQAHLGSMTASQSRKKQLAKAGLAVGAERAGVKAAVALGPEAAAAAIAVTAAAKALKKAKTVRNASAPKGASGTNPSVRR